MSFYTSDELNKLGFKFLGKNVLISRKASIYGAKYISINDNSRIDDYTILSTNELGISIGKNVHIAAFSLIIGKERVVLSDFSGLSSRVSIYSSSDDYSGEYMTNPCVPIKYRNVINAEVFLGRHVIIGANSTIMPGVSIQSGTAVGAYSFVTRSLPENIIASGIPARKIADRMPTIYELEKDFYSNED